MHVWRADLTALTDDCRELLSPAEQARADRFARERDRQLWTRAHGVLRALLGRYLARDPSALRFAAGAYGKPELVCEPPGSAPTAQRAPATLATLSFNLSHSGHLALYAFAATLAVGVDVEVARRAVNEVALAARAFGSAQAQRLAALDPVVREQEFLRAWVRHEAVLKCRGTGIGGAAAQTNGSEPWIAELDVGPRAAAAVALERPPRELCLWEWRA